MPMKTLFITILLALTAPAHAEDGYALWLRYVKVSDNSKLQAYRQAVTQIVVPSDPSPTVAAARDELVKGLSGLLDDKIEASSSITRDGAVVLAPSNGENPDGFAITSTSISGHTATLISGNRPIGQLYGAFHFLRLIQTGRVIRHLDISEQPLLQRRILSHWDNLNGLIERGYAGQSLWKWDELPSTLDPRYMDYARANASLGINGAILNNVNTAARLLEPAELKKVAALADVFRPYGIRVYLTAKFSAPIDIGGLATCDPLDPAVRQFWKRTADQTFALIPDFGGWQVKADSEGQPGPAKYGRTQADGANCLAEALAPHGGIVIWRAFVYGGSGDRALDSYRVFKPLDGQFAPNVVLTVKNGPVDFQPREPFHPLFGAMPKSQLFAELEITQEYIGHDWHLVYLGEEWQEFFRSDTHARGQGSTIGRIVDGSIFHAPITGCLGIANTGSDRNWCGSDFAQANWFAWGRLAWNHNQSAADIADDWIRMTWSNDQPTVNSIRSMMLGSWQTFIRYDAPLGLTFLQQLTSHFNPDPRGRTKSFGLDSAGIGMDRTTTGDNGGAQYFSPIRDEFTDIHRVDLKYLLWFHHVPWTEKLSTGRTLWEELCFQYTQGVHEAEQIQKTWQSLTGSIDPQRHSAVADRLARQVSDAKYWRDYSLRFFHTVSKLPLPADIPETGPLGPPKAKRDQEP
jgi:alpha-glucuronidase